MTRPHAHVPGGITTVEDIKSCRGRGSVSGDPGKALYEGRINPGAGSRHVRQSRSCSSSGAGRPRVRRARGQQTTRPAPRHSHDNEWSEGTSTHSDENPEEAGGHERFSRSRSRLARCSRSDHNKTLAPDVHVHAGGPRGRPTDRFTSTRARGIGVHCTLPTASGCPSQADQVGDNYYE